MTRHPAEAAALPLPKKLQDASGTIGPTHGWPGK